MAASMDYCPGGAEFDEDDEFDDGFMFGHDEINGFERSEALNVSNGNTNHYEDRGGFGTPSLNSKSPTTKSVALERKMKEATTVGADDFRMAILRGNLEAIKTFINKGYKVNTVLKCGWTPLMYAASSALPQIVKFLIDNGADPHSHKDMYTVLMAACGSAASSEEDILQCVSYLLEKGVNVNAHDRYHMSPLMYACREGRVKVISKLLDNQANINKQDSRGWTSLSWAVSKNHQGAVKFLVERGADIKKVHCDGQTALDIAIAQDLQAIIKLLGGDTSNNSTSSLSYSNSAFPTTNGWTQPPNSSIPEVSGPSKKAMIYGELELFLTGLGLNHLVQLFQEQQVDFDMFLRMTDEDLIKVNLHYISNMYTVLMAACGSAASSEEDILQCVSYLLEKGVNVNAHDRYHMSPLMYACREGRVKVISKLLDNQANINKQDSRGWTSLSWAVSKNHQGAVKLLVERGADIKKVHCDGQTALDIAIAQDLQAIIKLLGGDTSNNSNNSLSYSNSAFPITNGWTQPPNSSIPEVSGPSKKAMIYGELELFLTGLGLNHLVQLFQEQQVDFDMFLRMTDEDLIKMGIQQIGVRKKILDGIHMVHKREWEKESLPTVKYNKKMRQVCVEAVAIAANISKHIKYLGSTIHYIADQVTGNSSVLEIQDGATPKQLQKHCEETLANVELLQKELDSFLGGNPCSFDFVNRDPLMTLISKARCHRDYLELLPLNAHMTRV
uniref:Ankyrin repeat, SAM and basic leucine zipper domain-containing protein 1 n=1 Tax=Magallana gigas TaxID=29159 RepID=K1REN2_MAGGI